LALANWTVSDPAMAHRAAHSHKRIDKMCPDIMSTGFAGAVAAKIRIGDIGAVFAQGPIGLCATVTAGARLRGAGMIIAVDAVDAVDERLAMAMSLGADVTLDFRKVDVVAEILKLTGGVASMHPGRWLPIAMLWMISSRPTNSSPIRAMVCSRSPSRLHDR